MWSYKTSRLLYHNVLFNEYKIDYIYKCCRNNIFICHTFWQIRRNCKSSHICTSLFTILYNFVTIKILVALKMFGAIKFSFINFTTFNINLKNIPFLGNKREGGTLLKVDTYLCAYVAHHLDQCIFSQFLKLFRIQINYLFSLVQFQKLPSKPPTHHTNFSPRMVMGSWKFLCELIVPKKDIILPKHFWSLTIPLTQSKFIRGTPSRTL